MTRIAAAYLRRSSATENNPGNDSQAAQEAAVRKLCGEDVTLYVDWGVSGSGDGAKRPEYQRLKADIADGRVASVCAYSLSRLGRNARELLGLIELCRTHDVAVRTAMESIDTSSAFGRAMYGILAVFAELELDQGKERSASARSARKSRHEAAGLVMPGSLAPYGKRHATRDGLTYVEPDPDVDLSVIVDAYETAGSVRGAAVLLNKRGVPSPKGKLWSTSPLRRILERLAEDGTLLLPERSSKRRTQHRPSALFAGLLMCHCGRRMTPNVARGQYYCAAARSGPDHGRMSVTEKALVAVLRPEAEAYLRTIHLEDRTRSADIAKQEAVIERRQQAIDAKLDAGRISADAYRTVQAALLGELADLRRSIGIERILRVDAVPEWPEDGGAPQPMNVHLRRIWTHVQMDPDMKPLAYWRDTRWRYDPEAAEAEQAWLDQGAPGAEDA